jgi:adenylate cyclase
MTAPRRLAAILAADVAGYSRLMGADEEGTHDRLKAHRRELIDPKISEHSGRIVKTTGDGVLAEFPSVVDAVRCAAELQRGMIDREIEVPDERGVRFKAAHPANHAAPQERAISNCRLHQSPESKKMA